MNSLIELFEKGGVVMIALLLLSILLYERCFHLLLVLHRSHRTITKSSGVGLTIPSLRQSQEDLNNFSQQNMVKIRAMVAAAPLLGLLGTVIGMIETFESLANRAGENTVQGLSDGISMALITTETGLAIAIPAVVIINYAHRQLNASIRSLIAREGELMEKKTG